MAKQFIELDKKLTDLTKLKAEKKFKVKLNKKQIAKFVEKYKVFPSIKVFEKDLVAYIAKLGLKEGQEAKEEADGPEINPLVQEALDLGIITIPVGDSVVTVQVATDEQLVEAIAAAKELKAKNGEDVVTETKSLEDMNHEELKALGKEKGIKSWHLKSAEKLIEALKALEPKE